MNYQDFYGKEYEKLKMVERELGELVLLYAHTKREKEGIKPIVYSCSRIKTPDSMKQKLNSRGLEANVSNALSKMYDGVGVRVVCAFAEDVYRFVKWMKTQESVNIVKEKDYCEYPKPNGYRSYHILLEMNAEEIRGYHAEIQVRTIASDFWATLEHQLKYKQNLPNGKLIRRELKRCADEIASVDISMQTIRDIIRESSQEDSK